MSKRRVAVFDSNKEYIEDLLAHLKKKDRLFAEITGFTETPALSAYLEKHKVEILLFSMEDLIDEAVSEEEACDDFISHEMVGKFIYFGERRNSRSKVPHINKYQPVEAILKELEAELNLASGEAEKRKETSLVAIYSPAEAKSCIRTSLGVSKDLSRNAKVLLIDLERFSLLEDITGVRKSEGISPLIYFQKTDRKKIGGYIKKTAVRYEDTDIITAPEYMEDVNEISEEDWPDFLEYLGTEGGYDTVIINMAAAFRNITQIFEACERVYIPEPEEEWERAKLALFKKFIRKQGNEDLEKKMFIAKK